MAKILIVEDDAALQEAYSFILQADGHLTTSAYNGQEGLAETKKTTFDIILLDIHMPVMDGWEFLNRFQPRHSEQTKIIVFSNMVEADTQNRAMHFGVFKSVLKSSMTPLGIQKLIKDILE